MNVIIIILSFCYVTLLAVMVHSDNADELEFQRFLAQLNENAAMGKNGSLIKGIFRLSENGYLGRGGFGLTYKARFEDTENYNGKPVALKFTPIKDPHEAVREYQIYTYLWAIDNPVVESFGIPAVYYFDRSGDYVLMAITLLESRFNQMTRNYRFTFSDTLITFREFVRISKYIHVCGIRHDDIKRDNIMFLQNRAFIIDFNLAQKMHEFSNGGTLPYLPRSAHFNGIRCAKDDWESFLYSMCRIAGVGLDWFDMKDPIVVGQFKQNTTNTLKRIEEMPNLRARAIFLHFAKYVLDDNNNNPTGFPDYDSFYEYFERRMEKYKIPQPALVSWLSPEEKLNALQDLADNPILHISKMTQPVVVDESVYPKVNFFYFRRQYKRTSNDSFGKIINEKIRSNSFEKGT